MTPSRPDLKGSIPAMLTVPVGARRLPERSRSSVVLPAPFATGLLSVESQKSGAKLIRARKSRQYLGRVVDIEEQNESHQRSSS